MKQNYNLYTTEDFEVWKLLFERQSKNLENKVSDNFLTALNNIGFSSSEIPHFGKTDAVLEKYTGWKLKVVPNISPQEEFFKELSQKRFTSTCWLRKKSQLDYIEEPDMFHDVFGHVPLLTDKAYTDFFKGISDIALQNMQTPQVIEALGRMYWFTIEFGLMNENGREKIYGAGIISSAGETENVFSNNVVKRKFDVQEIMSTPFQNDRIQNKYFVIDSFEQLFESLPEIEKFTEEIKKQESEKL